jgi:hypothetical protein
MSNDTRKTVAELLLPMPGFPPATSGFPYNGSALA